MNCIKTEDLIHHTALKELNRTESEIPDNLKEVTDKIFNKIESHINNGTKDSPEEQEAPLGDDLYLTVLKTSKKVYATLKGEQKVFPRTDLEIRRQDFETNIKPFITILLKQLTK